MDWRQFVMDLETLNPADVEAIFARHGACSISLSDGGDAPVLEPAPGETPLWADTRISGLFTPDADLAALQRDLRSSLALSDLPAHRITKLADRDWEREWLNDFHAMRFGEHLWICPGDSHVDNDDAVIVNLDPGLAFGTGTHATTALCLEWLDGQNLSGRTLLDYGCGSGVLAIAALKLGCHQAIAMDIDPQAVTATTQNAESNQVATRLSVYSTAEEIVGDFDIVVANILAGPLIELAETISKHCAPGCLLALSGILSGQADDVLAAYRPWIAFDEPAFREQGGQTWTRLTGRRTES